MRDTRSDMRSAVELCRGFDGDHNDDNGDDDDHEDDKDVDDDDDDDDQHGDDDHMWHWSYRSR